VLPTSFADPPVTDELVSGETVEARFNDLVLGHAYGIAWTWASATDRAVRTPTG
jgi:hypothetical protein